MDIVRPARHRARDDAASSPDDIGAIVRSLRQARGITLAQLAVKCGYSVSALSRMERGKQPLRDVKVIRSLADALEIPPKALGLADTPQGYAQLLVHGTMVGTDPVPAEESDPMRRRTLLAGLTGATGVAMVSARVALAASPDGPLTTVADALLNPRATPPMPLARLRQQVAAAYATFDLGRYADLAARLPGLVSAALATRADQPTGEAFAATNGQLAELYTLASELMVKFSQDQLAWTTADRALQAAELSHDVLTQAAARRAWAIVLRRAGRADAAQRLVIDTAAALQPELNRGPEYLSVYGSLLCTAAYTAAVDGDRGNARTLVTEATEAAARLGDDANHRHTAFGHTWVGGYLVSIARVLGDSGTAIETARRIDPAAIPTAERRARHWANIARAFHQWGKPEQCYRALLAAERAAPDEVRYRQPIQHITATLLRDPAANRLPGLRAFAARTGTPV